MMEMKMSFTRETFIEMLQNDDREYVIRVIGRALLVVFRNQTETEKSANITNNHNMMGFTPADARQGSITAKYFIKHKTLLDFQIDMWLKLNDKGIPRVAKYWKQLADEIERKRNG